MSREAMKWALEALKELVAQTETGLFAVRHDHVAMNDARQAITALREALAEQPAIKQDLTPEPAQQGWKLVPREATPEMLKAMDECSKEGYDERLYAGHAASVYMAAVDAAPTPPAQRKPLTDEQLEKGRDKTFSINNPFCPCDSKTFRKVARWVEAAHGIKE